jgi:hypothetical protein
MPRSSLGPPRVSQSSNAALRVGTGFVGHFDDRAAATCRTETTTRNGDQAVTVEPILSELLCRAQLVITEAVEVQPPPR